MKAILTSIILGVFTLSAMADEFIQLSLTPDIAIQSRDTVINGLSLSIWGENEQHGLAIGIVNGSTGSSSGLSWGLVNYADSYKGAHLGFINWADDFEGLQWGTVNITRNFNGLQAGFINYTDTLEGVQLGLINIVNQNPWFDELPNKLARGFPFVNWSF